MATKFLALNMGCVHELSGSSYGSGLLHFLNSCFSYEYALYIGTTHLGKSQEMDKIKLFLKLFMTLDVTSLCSSLGKQNMPCGCDSD